MLKFKVGYLEMYAPYKGIMINRRLLVSDPGDTCTCTQFSPPPSPSVPHPRPTWDLWPLLHLFLYFYCEFVKLKQTNKQKNLFKHNFYITELFTFRLCERFNNQQSEQNWLTLTSVLELLVSSELRKQSDRIRSAFGIFRQVSESLSHEWSSSSDCSRTCTL